jgi:hypothetical protein
MLDFLIKYANVQLGSGRFVTIRRAGFGRLFCLYSYLIKIQEKYKYAEQLNKLSGEKLEVVISEVIELRRALNEEKSYFIVDETIDNIGEKELTELTDLILEFNSGGNLDNLPDNKGKTNKTISLIELEEFFVNVLAQVIERTGWKIEYVINYVSFVQIKALLNGFNHNRVEKIIDTAVAYSGNIENHINKIIGIREMSLSEFMEEIDKREKTN